MVKIISEKLQKIMNNNINFSEFVNLIVENMKKNNISELTIKGYIHALTKLTDYIDIEHINNKSLTRNELIFGIQKIEDSFGTERKTTKMSTRPTDIWRTTDDALGLSKYIIQTNYLPNLGSRNIIHNELNIKPKNIELIRDHFTPDELELIANVKKSFTESLIFCIFLTTGIRVGGLFNLCVKNVYDDNLNPLTVGETIEKGKKIRSFYIFDILRKELLNYSKEKKNILLSPEHYIFPSRHMASCTQHLSTCTINSIIKNVSNRAGVYGEHTHCHALRKTVVTNLMRGSNTLEQIAKFIGHNDPSTTAIHYWDEDPLQLAKNMNIPWVTMKNSSTYSNNSIESEQIIILTNEIINCEKNRYLKKKLEELLDDDQREKIKNMWTLEMKKQLVNKIYDSLEKISKAAISSCASLSNITM